MFSSRHLAMGLTVGVLVAVLGMIATFQVDDAEAHRYTWIEIIMGRSPTTFHRETTRKWMEIVNTGISLTWKENCRFCSTGKISYTSIEKCHTEYEKKTDHYSFTGVYLGNCHTHNKKSKGSTLHWTTTSSRCSNS